jgi:predicted aconitase
MVSARSAILSASTAVAGSTALEHVNSLSPGVRTGDITIDQIDEIELIDDSDEMLIFNHDETLEINENETLEMNQGEDIQINC